MSTLAPGLPLEVAADATPGDDARVTRIPEATTAERVVAGVAPPDDGSDLGTGPYTIPVAPRPGSGHGHRTDTLPSLAGAPLRPALPALLLAACETPIPCNGHLALCDRPLDRVVLPATHNAMSTAEDGFTPPNHDLSVRHQLADGVRGMLLDTYWWEEQAHLCHGFCELGATPLADTLGDLAAFLDANPGEVLVLVLQDDLSPERTEEAFRDAGLLDRAIRVTDPGAAWPTLGELIEADTRLLITRESGGDGPDWYRPFYDLGFDTPYSFRRVDDFSCDVLRGDAAHSLFLLNHWLSDPLPRPSNADLANAAEVLGARVADCTAAFGRPPNLVAVDFYERGDLFRVVDRANGVAEAP